MAGTTFLDCEDLRKVGFPHGETAYGAFVREGVDLSDKGLTEVRVAFMHRDECPTDPNDWDSGKITIFYRSGPSDDDLAALGYKGKARADQYARQISVYDHSGIAIWRTGGAHGYHQHGAWDTSTMGGIWQADETQREEFAQYKRTITRKGSVEYAGKVYTDAAEIVNRYADNDIETYQQYINGDVYGYVVKDMRKNKSGRWVEWDVLDSCWGYFGYDYATEGIANEIAYLFRDAPEPVTA